MWKAHTLGAREHPALNGMGGFDVICTENVMVRISVSCTRQGGAIAALTRKRRIDPSGEDDININPIVI